VLASELPNCQLEGRSVASSILERSRPSPDAGSMLVVRGSLRNGAAIAYAKDDPVLVVDLQVVRAVPSVVPTIEMRLRNSWVLSPSFWFAADRPLHTPREWVEGDKVYRILRLSDGSVLFVNPEGRFCNKAVNARSQPNVWMAGTLSQEPDGAELLPKVIEEPGESGSLRIVFNGIGAGQMSFQEVWVNGTTVASSMARNFDQFAKNVKVGPFKFEVVEVGTRKITLRYEIAERGPIGAGDLTSMPMRNRR
jgi:hypothetical protein